ncbi:c-type cytochrome [Acidovorax sp. Q11]
MQKNTMMVAVAIVAALLAGCGDKKPEPAAAAAPAAAPAPVAAPAPAAENELGKGVFGKTCAMCHAAGVAGAPKPGDKADWGPRIAQGKDTLYKHAIEGYTGAKGMMPAKGGAANLSDAEVKAAVDYMADKSL